MRRPEADRCVMLWEIRLLYAALHLPVQREAEEQRKAAEERQRRMERIKRRKAQGLQDRYLYDYTFSNDNGQNPLMDKDACSRKQSIPFAPCDSQASFASEAGSRLMPETL